MGSVDLGSVGPEANVWRQGAGAGNLVKVAGWPEAQPLGGPIPRPKRLPLGSASGPSGLAR